MSLIDLFIKLKGGSGSGHWGHRGKIGVHGGSAPGGGLAAIGVSKGSSVEERREAKKKMPSLKITREFEDNSWTTYKNKEEAKMVRMYAQALEDFEDPSGLKIKIESISYGSYSHTVEAKIFDKDGNQAGRMTRDFIFNNKEVHHDYFELSSQYQGSGFGSRLYYASERLYPSMGYDKVSIYANIDVGGYAWGRMGYDFKENSKDSMVNRFRRAYDEAYGSNPPFIPQTAYEMAAFKGPDGRRIGKEAMLNSSWGAIKNLNSKDPGYQAGLEYYKSKGII